MFIVNLPAYDKHWPNETRYPYVYAIADVMSSNRCKSLCVYLHVMDSSKLDKTGNKIIILCKIQSVLNHVSKKCRYIELDINQSINEHLNPTKMKRSWIRRYSPQKLRF